MAGFGGIADVRSLRKTPPERGISLLCVTCQFDNVSGVLVYQLDPVIRCKDAVPELGKPVTETPSVDDLREA